MNKNMNNWRRCLKVSIAVIPLSLASVAASAGIIGVGFTTIGSGTSAGSCGASCTSLELTGTTNLSGLNGYFGSSGTPEFTFSAQLAVTPDGFGSLATGVAPSGGWQLWDTAGDRLYGSVTGLLTGSPSDPAGLLALDFDITGGSGLFDNVSGFGSAIGGLSSSDAFGEAGLMLMTSPAAANSVPEPGTLALFAAALAGLAWTARRRRFALDAR